MIKLSINKLPDKRTKLNKAITDIKDVIAKLEQDEYTVDQDQVDYVANKSYSYIDYINDLPNCVMQEDLFNNLKILLDKLYERRALLTSRYYQIVVYMYEKRYSKFWAKFYSVKLGFKFAWDEFKDIVIK